MANSLPAMMSKEYPAPTALQVQKKKEVEA